MIDFDSTFEQKCEEYLLYLTELGAQKYSDCPDIDSLIQDAMMAFIIKKKQRRGDRPSKRIFISYSQKQAQYVAAQKI